MIGINCGCKCGDLALVGPYQGRFIGECELCAAIDGQAKIGSLFRRNMDDAAKEKL